MTDADQGEFIQVVFDNTITNFESELGSLSLEKMMNISYSEEILQKNFNVIINILKQLYRQSIDLTAGVKDNREWVQKLKEIANTNPLKDKMEKMDQSEKQVVGSIVELQSQINLLNKKCLNHDKEFLNHQDSIDENTKELEQIKLSIGELKKSISPYPDRMKDIETRLSESINTQKQKNSSIDSILAQMRQEMDSFNTKSLQMLSAASNHTNTHSNTHQQNIIINNNIVGAEVRSAQEIEVVPPNEEANDEFRRRLNRHDQDLMRLSELQPRVTSSEEEIQRLWEKIEQMRGDVGPSSVGGGGVDSNELDTLRTQLRVLQGQMEQMTTQNMLMGALGGGEEMDENKMALILSEISKVQNNFSKYVLIVDWESESKKINQRLKVIGDSVSDSTEKVRRELTTKINQKLDVSEALKIVNEINFLKEQIQAILSQKSGNNNNSASTSNAAMDPNISNKIRDLSDQLHNLENEVKNHRIQYSGFVNNTNTKIGDLEKKIQSLQLDRIFSEMQLLREISDQIKKDSDSNVKKIKEINRRIENHISKEETITMIELSFKTLRDELILSIRDLDDAVKAKADLEDLSKVEQNMLMKLEEIVQALIKQLANKQETKKALIYLEQKINQIFVILEGDGVQKDGDGLFTKRPLLWSCASCDKDLDKFKGQLGEYKGWAIFPPKETSPERMGRFGVGYKNMQDKVKVNRDRLEKERDRFNAQEVTQSRQLPNKTSGGEQGFYNTMHGNHTQSISNPGDHLPKINSNNKQ